MTQNTPDPLDEILEAMAFRCAGGITDSGRKEYLPAKSAINKLIMEAKNDFADYLIENLQLLGVKKSTLKDAIHEAKIRSEEQND